MSWVKLSFTLQFRLKEPILGGSGEVHTLYTAEDTAGFSRIEKEILYSTEYIFLSGIVWSSLIFRDNTFHCDWAAACEHLAGCGPDITTDLLVFCLCSFTAVKPLVSLSPAFSEVIVVHIFFFYSCFKFSLLELKRHITLNNVYFKVWRSCNNNNKTYLYW